MKIRKYIIHLLSVDSVNLSNLTSVKKGKKKKKKIKKNYLSSADVAQCVKYHSNPKYWDRQP